ncbi:tetratricopeptide repeat protein [Pseudoduganella umbonata]|uniref:protein O-GlcNAc transferase n=1 Tax=Pseudoduganella umbonata TaxID=864828 RepID=A0ABX5UKJ4_9BURK|nr:tetratricopeptide repeat protein [Pseudoduganella umbonata]
MNLPANLNGISPDVILRAKQGVLPLGELFEGAQALQAANEPQQAANLYKVWLEHTHSPLAFAAWFNLGVVQAEIGDDAAAEVSYGKAILQNPGFIEPRLNLGTLCERRGRPDDALSTWQAILDEVPESAEHMPLKLQAINNIGRLLENLKRLPEAAAWLTRSLELKPDQPKVLTHWIHLRQKLCRWPVYQPFGDVTPEIMRECTSSLATLAQAHDPAEQLAASRRYIDEKVPGGVRAQLAPTEGYPHKRMRIGYLSSDLCSHAVSILTAELYELHDRERVEVYAFSWSREDNSPLRARVVGAMDHYIRIDHMTDEEAARCICENEIDILVDLHGLTSGARVSILSYRAAPVQLTWLGFPGTTAIPGVDYVIADDFVLPPELEPFFTEKPLRMPQTFQINDRQRKIAPPPRRIDNGLPEDKFVFCCFNSNFKIGPDVFAAWMRILQQVPDSVLWVVADVEGTKDNLWREAAACGIGPDRLIFAGRVVPADYLARFQLADLFLDTAPFNAGTTASDALWAGLPVLTWSGRTFSSRMAGSLLHAVGLPELVTHTLADYEAVAIALGNDRARMLALRQRLAANLGTSALFDTPRFVRDYEDLLETVVRRPAGVPLRDDPAPDAVGLPDAGELSIQLGTILNMVQPGIHSVVEVGGASLMNAWRARRPNSHFTSIDPAGQPRITNPRAIVEDPEQLNDREWQSLTAAQCWLFPQTLERLSDPWQFLQRIRLSALGKPHIVACITNGQHWQLQSLLSRGALHEAGALADRRGRHWFTRASLAAMLAECGFAIVEMRTVLAPPPDAATLQAIRQLATAAGGNPDLAEQDAMPYQYIVHAVAR